MKNQFKSDVSDYATSMEKIEYDKIYLKVIERSLKHNGLKFKKGLVKDILPFDDDPKKTCTPGRIYVTTIDYVFEFCHYGTIVAKVKIPRSARFVFEQKKIGLSEIEIIEMMPMNDWLSEVKPVEIGGAAYFPILTSAKGLESLTKIGGPACFPNLTSAKGLEKLAKIGGGIDLDGLPEEEYKKLIKQIGR